MNNEDQAAESIESHPMPYRDCSLGLTLFGILTIALGGLSGSLVLLILASQALTASMPNQHHLPLSTLLPAFAIYGGLGVALIWLGIGSILARRWARALLLIFSWSWLGLGVIMIVEMAFIMPTVMKHLPTNGPGGHPALTSAAVDGVLYFMFLVHGFLFIVLPAIWTFFYSSRHVKATCEALDPLPSWTDACPLPVLGLCLWLLLGAPILLIMPFIGHAVMPFFGMFLTGVPGSILCLALPILWAYSAWLMYRLDPLGWWIILIAICLFSVSSFLTYMQHDVLEMYQLMGYPQDQIDQIKKTGLLEGNRMTWLMSFSLAPFLGYLLFIKRYFAPKS